jgi:hypothetical protein
MPNDLITEFLEALRKGDELNLARLETYAGQHDASNPFGPRLVDELRALRYPSMAA